MYARTTNLRAHASIKFMHTSVQFVTYLSMNALKMLLHRSTDHTFAVSNNSTTNNNGIYAQVVVFGDIHGQIFDLFAHFDAVGWPGKIK